MDDAGIAEGFAIVEPLDGLTFSVIDTLPLDPLRTLGPLDALAFSALEALPLGALRTLCALRTLTFYALWTLGALECLSFHSLRTLGALDTLTFSPLWAFCPLGAFGPLRTFGPLRALCLAFLTALARLSPGIAIAIAAALGACRNCQRERCNTGDQCKLASHLLLLAYLKS